MKKYEKPRINDEDIINSSLTDEEWGNILV